MGKKVFISYSHKQEKWVLDKLVPALHIGGAEVLIDRERFKAGLGVIGQMDALQDSADISVLVISNDYLKSPFCMHEMDRAVGKDPDFSKGSVIPVVLEALDNPPTWLEKLKYVEMRDDKDSSKWNLLMERCEADVGTDVQHLLEIKNNLCRLLQRNQSVNLVVQGKPKWHELISYIYKYEVKDLKDVDLDAPSTFTRRGIVQKILNACDIQMEVPPEPHDLETLESIGMCKKASRLVFKHFENIDARSYCDVNFFAALRYLMNNKSLVLLIQSRKPLELLLPKTHPLSAINVTTVELNGGVR